MVGSLVAGLVVVTSLVAPADGAVLPMAAPAPTITVTPSTGLLNGQSVTVTGSGFSTDVTAISLVQVSSDPCCQVSGEIEVPALGGSFSTSFAVTRAVGGGDCVLASPACVIAAGNLDGGTAPFEEVAVGSLAFQDVDIVSTAPIIIRNATAANESATVSWQAPVFDGGAPITWYAVTPYYGYFPLPPVWFNSPATTQTILGLTNGVEYRFRVRAYNGVGRSDQSKVTNPVTPSA
ncbi:MAG: fibronectin type III domain-containing protein [Actinomycetota bacterium]